jgi:hypothetical protein
MNKIDVGGVNDFHLSYAFDPFTTYKIGIMLRSYLESTLSYNYSIPANIKHWLEGIREVLSIFEKALYINTGVS